MSTTMMRTNVYKKTKYEKCFITETIQSQMLQSQPTLFTLSHQIVPLQHKIYHIYLPIR